MTASDFCRAEGDPSSWIFNAKNYFQIVVPDNLNEPDQAAIDLANRIEIRIPTLIEKGLELLKRFINLQPEEWFVESLELDRAEDGVAEFSAKICFSHPQDIYGLWFVEYQVTNEEFALTNLGRMQS